MIIEAITIMVPFSIGKSLDTTAFTISVPRPGRTKTFSITVLVATIIASWTPITGRTGTSEFFRT